MKGFIRLGFPISLFLKNRFFMHAVFFLLLFRLNCFFVTERVVEYCFHVNRDDIETHICGLTFGSVRTI